MLSDIFWHPYFNIFGELFVDDPDKGKDWVTFVGKYFRYYIYLNNESFLHQNDKIYGKSQLYILKKGTQCKKHKNTQTLFRHYISVDAVFYGY